MSDEAGFKSFDFESSSEWKRYFSNFTAPLSGGFTPQEIEYYKRKFYHNFVDSTFVVGSKASIVGDLSSSSSFRDPRSSSSPRISIEEEDGSPRPPRTASSASSASSSSSSSARSSPPTSGSSPAPPPPSSGGGGSGGSGSSSSSSSSSSSGAGGSGASLWSRLSPHVLSLQFVWFVVHLNVVMNAPFMLVPSLSVGSYSRAMFYSGAANALSVYSYVGRPQLNIEWWKRLLTLPDVHYIFFSFVCISIRPMILPLVPIFTYSLYHSATYVRSLLKAEFKPLLSPRVESAFSYLDRQQGIATDMAAQVEVYYAILLTVVAFTPMTAGYMAPVLLWQFVRLRFIFSLHTKRAFANLDRSILSIVSKCPPAVSSAYFTFKDYLYRFATHDVVVQQVPQPR